MRYIVNMIFLGLALSAMAQAPTYMDLKQLYADQDYEKLIKKAIKYTEKDDTKKDPAPYLWLSRGYYQTLSESSEPKEVKKDLKDAIKVLSKAMRYDKDNLCLPEFEDYVNDFKYFVANYILNKMYDSDFRSASIWIMKYQQITTNTLGATYLAGVCKFKSNDKTAGAKIWNKAEKEMIAITSIDSWSPADVLLLKKGVLQTIACFELINQTDKSKNLLNKTAPWFEEDPEFHAAYDDIIN
jgi:tetratricopeptide (TPR) repeat protein